MVWMNTKGMLEDSYEKKDVVQDFVNKCLEAQDSSNTTILSVVPKIWDRLNKIEG
jgi:hypothetical protein